MRDKRNKDFKTKTTIFGYPLVHIAYGRNENGKIRVAKGWIAIGQFAIGVIAIGQFGIGILFGLGQFIIASMAIAQFAIGGLLGIGQIATGIMAIGQFVVGYYVLAQYGIFKFSIESGFNISNSIEYIKQHLSIFGLIRDKLFL